MGLVTFQGMEMALNPFTLSSWGKKIILLNEGNGPIRNFHYSCHYRKIDVCYGTWPTSLVANILSGTCGPCGIGTLMARTTTLVAPLPLWHHYPCGTTTLVASMPLWQHDSPILLHRRGSFLEC